MDTRRTTPLDARIDVADSECGVYADLYAISYKEAAVKPLKVTEDIRSLSEFRSGVASFVRQVNETRRPLVLTQHGRGVAVLVDIEEFEAMRERIETLEDLRVAEAQIAAGEVVSQEEAFEHVLKAIGE